VPGVDVLVEHAVEEGHLDALVDVGFAAVREGQREIRLVHVDEWEGSERGRGSCIIEIDALTPGTS